MAFAARPLSIAQEGGIRASRALDEVSAGRIPTKRAPVSGFLNCLKVVAGTADAVAVGGIEAQRTPSFSFLNCAAGVTTRARHAVTARAVVAKRAASNLGQGLHRLLGKGTSCRQSCNRAGKEQPIAAQRLLRHRYRLAQISQLQPSHAGTA